MAKTRKVTRSADTGRFVSPRKAKTSPKTTVTEMVKVPRRTTTKKK